MQFENTKVVRCSKLKPEGRRRLYHKKAWKLWTLFRLPSGQEGLVFFRYSLDYCFTSFLTLLGLMMNKFPVKVFLHMYNMLGIPCYHHVPHGASYVPTYIISHPIQGKAVTFFWEKRQNFCDSEKKNSVLICYFVFFVRMIKAKENGWFPAEGNAFSCGNNQVYFILNIFSPCLF